MRIISGNSKGKKILEPKDINTRPLKDLTKESIFNILTHSNKFNVKLENANVLDLFSGVGSFGLECLSRGSSNLTFVENYNIVLPILKRNISNLNYQDRSIIIESNIINGLNLKTLKRKFDIIFIDPPYKEKNLSSVLNNIIESNVLSVGGIIIIHRHKKNKEKFTEKFKIIEEKTYGISIEVVPTEVNEEQPSNPDGIPTKLNISTEVVTSDGISTQVNVTPDGISTKHNEEQVNEEQLERHMQVS